MKASATQAAAETAEGESAAGAEAPALAPEVAGEPPPKRKEGAPASDAPRERGTSATRQMDRIEDLALLDWLTAMGSEGAFRIALTREKPQYLSVGGKQHDTKGFLQTYENFMSEEDILRDWGGGTYSLRVTKKGDDGSYKYHRHRTVTIAGDPRTDRLPGAPAAAAPSASTGTGESASIVKATFDVLKDQLERSHQQQHHQPRGIDPAVQMLVDQMRTDAAAREREMLEMRREIGELRTVKPAEDPIRDHLLGNLIKGESGRIAAIEASHESEIRALREGHRQEVERIQDRHDRAMEMMRSAHADAVATIKASYEREIASSRTLTEVMQASSRTTTVVQNTTLNAEIRRLTAENDKVERELRELREKKDKSLTEQIKEIDGLKELIGGGEDGGTGAGIIKIAEMLPSALEALGHVIRPGAGGGQPQAQAAQAQAAQAAAQAQPRVFKDPRSGRRFAAVQGPQGGQLVPLKRRPQIGTKEDGSQIELPEVEPAQIAMLVPYLEQAFRNEVEPVVVAQSGGSFVPPNVLAWIRENDSEAKAGIDLFMSQVVKLPGTSPLSTQAGRNWLRKLGKALVGEE